MAAARALAGAGGEAGPNGPVPLRGSRRKSWENVVSQLRLEMKSREWRGSVSEIGWFSGSFWKFMDVAPGVMKLVDALDPHKTRVISCLFITQ
jgi:hypothetical protein